MKTVTKIKFKVLLTQGGGFAQYVLRSRDKTANQFVLPYAKHNRVSIARAFKLFKDETILEITIKEVKK